MSIRIYWIDVRTVDPDSPRVRALMSARRREKLDGLPLINERRRSAAAAMNSTCRSRGSSWPTISRSSAAAFPLSWASSATRACSNSAAVTSA